MGLWRMTQEDMKLHWIRQWMDTFMFKREYQIVLHDNKAKKIEVLYRNLSDEEATRLMGNMTYSEDQEIEKQKTSEEARWIYYPLLYCPACMASLWTFEIYLCSRPIGPQTIWELPVAIFAVSFCNLLLLEALNRLENVD